MQQNNGIELCFTRSQAVSLRFVQFIRPKVFKRVLMWMKIRRMHRCGFALRFGHSFFFCSFLFWSVCLNFVLGPMPRCLVAAVNGNFMTSLTLITFIKLSCRTHVVDCTFMCLLGNLNLLRCLLVARPAFSSPIRQIYERRESPSLSALGEHIVLALQCNAARPSWSYLAITDQKYQWTEFDVISNSNYVVQRPRERESLLSHFRSKWFSKYVLAK